MPRWIYIAPPDSCAKSEQAVAAFFSTLGPEFTIRWGFPYKDNGSVWREGDFIIQGPDGHILVVEAKGGPCTLGPPVTRHKRQRRHTPRRFLSEHPCFSPLEKMKENER